MANTATLTLAVAGSRKTQSIIEECAKETSDKRILVLTYTSNNQLELRSRLATYAGDHHLIDVQGWFAFLIKHLVKPYIPYSFPGRRVRGFDFHTEPQRWLTVDNWQRYLDSQGRAYKVHLPQLACRIDTASQGKAIARLKRLYDRIYIDEVQDLCGYDLEVLKLLMASGIELRMVGDVRQAVLATNVQEAKNKQYKFMGIWKWFQQESKLGHLIISQSCTTWRCRPEIALFADSLFGSEWGFEATVSVNDHSTGHDGLFLVKTSDLELYVAAYSPLMLRYSKSSAKSLPFSFVNYKESKGLSVGRVCVYPTDPIKKLLMKGSQLDAQQAAELYVAVTRAQQSVAFVLDIPGLCKIPFWSP